MTKLLGRVARAPSLLALALVVGCGGGSKAPTVPHNRASTEGGAGELAPSGPLFLWCAAPRGEMCGRASRALRASHTPAESLPAQLFESEWRDLDEDCADPDLAELLAILGTALGVPATGWVDQAGSPTVERLEIVVHGGGCTNLTAEGVPDVKVQLVEGPVGMIALVRVWELEAP